MTGKNKHASTVNVTRTYIQGGTGANARSTKKNKTNRPIG